MKNPAFQPYIWILISGLIFSGMATLAPLAGQGCGWQIVAIARCAIPLVLVALWAKSDGVKLVFWGPPVLWLRSLAGSCSLVGTFFCFGSQVPLTDIYTITNMFPIWVALLSWPMLGRSPSLSVWLSILCSILGVALIQGSSFEQGNWTALVIVPVSIFTALAMMGLNRLSHLDPRAVVVHFSATGLLFSLLSLLFFPLNLPENPFQVHHLFELVGVGVTAMFGQYFLTRAFTAGDPAKVSVASLSQFVFVLLLDVLVLDHPISLNKLWGIPLILGPTMWLMLQRVKPEVPAVTSDDQQLILNNSTTPAEATVS